MLTSFLRLRLAITVRRSISMATFRSVALRNLIGVYSREPHVPSLTSSMKATAPTSRLWSSMVLDRKEEEKQIDGSDKIAQADGMGDVDEVDDPTDKFDDKEFLQRSWEEGRVREVFQEWKKEHERLYANAEEEEMTFKLFESTFKFIVEANSKGNSLGLSQFGDLTEDKMKRRCGAGAVDFGKRKIERSLLRYYGEERVPHILSLADMMAYDYSGQLFKDPDDASDDASDDEYNSFT